MTTHIGLIDAVDADRARPGRAHHPPRPRGAGRAGHRRTRRSASAASTRTRARTACSATARRRRRSTPAIEALRADGIDARGPLPGRHRLLPRRPRRLRPHRRDVPRPGPRPGEGARHRGRRQHHGRPARSSAPPSTTAPPSTSPARASPRPRQHDRGAAPGRRDGAADRTPTPRVLGAWPSTPRERAAGEIVRLATTTGLASVEELSARFGVTASTIRRDLAKLTAQGRLARTYGGAIALARHPEASLRQRSARPSTPSAPSPAGRPRRSSPARPCCSTPARRWVRWPRRSRRRAELTELTVATTGISALRNWPTPSRHGRRLLSAERCARSARASSARSPRRRWSG